MTPEASGAARDGSGLSAPGLSLQRVAFAVTAGLAAVLLFSIQPLLGKALLPGLGGSPLAWATVMVFFQSIVLLGYALAHGLVSWLGPRRQAIVHILLIGAGVASLPIPHELSPVGGSGEPAMVIPSLLLDLALPVGLPCLAVAGSAPTLQRWFAALGRDGARDPYWLYVASNLGSLVALFAYPLALEPLLGLETQAAAWSWAYGGLLLVTAGCASWLLRGTSNDRNGTGARPRVPAPNPIGWSRRLRWVLYAAIPSGLTLASTTHVTTDLAPVPLLWTTPLAVYLASFALTFSRFGSRIHRWLVPLTPIAVLPLIPLLVLGVSTPIWVVVVVHLLALAWFSTVLHGELAATRPEPRKLTAFYAWLGLGGVLGGAAVALLAPMVFSRAIEYPLLVGAALCLIPRGDATRGGGPRMWLASLLIGALGIVALVSARGDDPISGESVSYGGFALMLLPFLAAHRWHRIGGWALAGLLLLGSVMVEAGRPAVHARRSMFASYRVGEDPRHQIRYLAHGNTIHGAQSTRPELASWGLPYYPPGSPMPELFAGHPATQPRAAVLGLGIGAMAPIAEEHGWTMRFFELDPVVVDLARDEFDFLDRCADHCEVVVGDGRVELARDPLDYDIIVLDAFSSSAVPIHLLTREALSTYEGRLREGGVIAVHVTNRHVDLADVVAATAGRSGLRAIHREHVPDRTALPDGLFVATSHWILLVREGDEPGDLGLSANWDVLTADTDTRPWSDDYANPLATYRWRVE